MAHILVEILELSSSQREEAKSDVRSQRPLCAKLRRTQPEQMFSGVLLPTDIARGGRHVANVPLSDINDEPTIELTYDRLSDYSRLDDCVRDSQVLQSVASGHQGLLPRRGMPF
jgi:hypothetical protein